MSDTTPTDTGTTGSGDSGSTETPQAGILGSLQTFFASMNPLYGLLASATDTDIKEVIKNPTDSFRSVKMSVGSFIVDSSLVVLGIVALFFAVTVAIGQDKLSAVSGIIKAVD